MGIFPGTKLKGKERYGKLYHYTSFDAFVKIWLTKKLKFGIIENQNDLQEVSHSVSCCDLYQTPLMYAYNDEILKYKQLSFTMDYDSYIKGCMSTMMWGHYGNKRRGVCIELEYNKLKFPKNIFKGIVKYKRILNKSAQIPNTATSIQDIKKFIIKNIRENYFTKNTNWRGENEYRIISNNLYYLDIQDAITAIYLTSYESEECLLTEMLVGELVPVKYFYFGSSNNKSIPQVSETKKTREQLHSAKMNPDNYLNSLMESAKLQYEKMKRESNLFSEKLKTDITILKP